MCLEYLRSYSFNLGKFSVKLFFTCKSCSGEMEGDGVKAWGWIPLDTKSGVPAAKEMRTWEQVHRGVGCFGLVVFCFVLFCIFWWWWWCFCVLFFKNSTVSSSE